MKKLYIFKVGETFKNTKEKFGDFDSWIKNFITSNIDIEVVDILGGGSLPAYENCLGVVITGSHSMVTQNLSWSVNTEKWIQEAKDKSIPILGICYGHQLLTKSLGGVVENNPNGKEISTVEVFTNENLTDDLLFKDFSKSFKAHVTHMQSAIVLPKGAVTLAFNSHDKNQIVRFEKLIWGVQFHPEFDEQIMIEYIKEQKDELEKMGYDFDDLLNQVSKTSLSNEIIERFVRLIKLL